MITKFVIWAPYGGPPEDDVWVEFGLSYDRFMERVTAIVTDCLQAFVPETERRLLLRARRELISLHGRGSTC